MAATAVNAWPQAMSSPTENQAHFTSAPTRQGDTGNKWSKGKGKRTSKFFCDYCRKEGHDKDHCWVLHPHLRPTKRKVTEENYVVSDSNSDLRSKVDLILQHLQLAQKPNSGDVVTETRPLAKFGKHYALSSFCDSKVVVDSGATDNMCCSPHLLSDITMSDNYPYVSVANGSLVPT